MLSGSFFADGRRSLDRGLEALLVHRMDVDLDPIRDWVPHDRRIVAFTAPSAWVPPRGSCDPQVAPVGSYVRSGEAVELEALDARRTAKGPRLPSPTLDRGAPAAEMERLCTACLLIGATSTFARYRSSKPVGPCGRLKSSLFIATARHLPTRRML